MAEAWLLSGALASAVCGVGSCALAMQPHATRAGGPLRLEARMTLRLRLRGTLCLAVALGLCLAADHASIAALVWVMLTSLSVVLIALVLAFQPRWLGILLVGTREVRP